MRQLLLVDREDRIIGYGEKQEIHAAGLLHRAFSIFIYHEKTGKFLLQKRSKMKYHSGGFWSNSCCSHPYRGEVPLESYHRCLIDELRHPFLNCIVREAGSFLYYSYYGDNSEHELDHVVLFICKELQIPVLNPNPLEVESYLWATVAEIREELGKEPQIFTSWFPQAFALAVECLDHIYLSKSRISAQYSARSLNHILRSDCPRLSSPEGLPFPYDRYYPAFNQGKTGYCWLVSALYGMSLKIWNSQGCPKEPVLFSKDRLIFFDKLEKANHFLELMIQMIDTPVDAAPLSYLLSHPMRDQGHWNMAWSLIAKYGLTAYDPNCDITLGHSLKVLNGAISMILRLGTYELRALYASTGQMKDVMYKKTEIVEKVRHLLLDYWYSSTRVSINLSDTLICPISDLWINTIGVSCGYGRPGTCYDILYDGNLEEGYNNSFLELCQDQFLKVIQEEIRRFGFCLCCCDSSKFFDRRARYCSDDSFDFSSYTNDMLYRSLPLEKRISYHLSTMSHSIVLLNLPSNSSEGYLAFDPAVGEKCTIAPGWLERYVSIALIHKTLLPPECTFQSRISVTPWEHFGI